MAKWSSEDEQPVEPRVYEHEGHVVVHRRPGQALRLEIEAHALIKTVRDRPDDIELSVGASNMRYLRWEVQQEQNWLGVKAPHEAGKHGEGEPEHGLLKPYACHLRVTRAHGLTNQRIKDLIER